MTPKKKSMVLKNSLKKGPTVGNEPPGAASKPISLHPLKIEDVLRAALETPPSHIEAPKPKPKKKRKTKR